MWRNLTDFDTLYILDRKFNLREANSNYTGVPEMLYKGIRRLRAMKKLPGKLKYFSGSRDSKSNLRESSGNYQPAVTYTEPEMFFNGIIEFYRQFDSLQEHLSVIFLNASNKVIGIKKLFSGSLDQCFACPATILRFVLLSGARKFILVHNHPSGNLESSREDIRITHQVAAAASLLNVGLLDHMICGRNEWGEPEVISMLREGRTNFNAQAKLQ